MREEMKVMTTASKFLVKLASCNCSVTATKEPMLHVRYISQATNIITKLGNLQQHTTDQYASTGKVYLVWL